jgi:hypothetical protein
MHHESTGTELVNEALNHLSHLLEGYAMRDSKSSSVSRHENAFADQTTALPNVSSYMRLSMNLFEQGQPLQAGRLLRHAFLLIETALSNLRLTVTWELVVIPILDMLLANRFEILSAFLAHIASFASVRVRSHPIGLTASTLASLVRHEPEKVRQYVGAAHDLLYTTLARHFGRGSHSALIAKQDVLGAHLALGRGTRNLEWALRGLLAEHDGLLEDARADPEVDGLTVLNLEVESALVQAQFRMYREDFALRVRWSLDAAKRRMLRFECGSLPDGTMSAHAKAFFYCLIALAHHALDKGEPEKACCVLNEIEALGSRVEVASVRDVVLVNHVAGIRKLERQLRMHGETRRADRLALMSQQALQRRMESLSMA